MYKICLVPAWTLTWLKWLWILTFNWGVKKNNGTSFFSLPLCSRQIFERHAEDYGLVSVSVCVSMYVNIKMSSSLSDMTGEWMSSNLRNMSGKNTMTINHYERFLFSISTVTQTYTYTLHRYLKRKKNKNRKNIETKLKKMSQHHSHWYSDESVSKLFKEFLHF